MNTLILIVAILSIIQVCHAATTKPTRSPTTKPKPTTKPTQIPTPVPTVTPTETPTLSPTITPTLSPTLTPTNGPTTQIPTDYVKPELVRNASSKGGQVAGAFLGILFAAFVIYLWYSKTYGPIFKDSGDYVAEDEHNIEIKNPMTHNSIQIHSNDDDKF